MPILGELFRTSVRRHGNRVAVVDTSEQLAVTYRELDLVTNCIASVLLGLDINPGDHVAICARNSIYWIACEAALAKCGMVVIPINIYLSSSEVGWLLADSEARAVFFDEDQERTVAEALHEATRCEHAVRFPASGLSAPAWSKSLPSVAEALEMAMPDVDMIIKPAQPHRILYTSGTTGRPKGVICSNEITVGAVVTTLANQLHDLLPEDRLLITTPLTHVANSFFWPFFAFGCLTVLMRRYEPARFCEILKEHSITHSIMAPTLLADLANHLEENPSARQSVSEAPIRAIWYAGSPMPAALSERAERLLGPVLNQQYGLTEMISGFPAVSITELRSEWHARKRQSCGRPILGAVVKAFGDDGHEVETGQVGEIAIMMQSKLGGYWRSPEGEGAYRGDWLFTGDLGWFDEDGFLYLHDRQTDMIVSGGLNVYPTEVENVLLSHPSVSACSVIGMADDRWIEVPWAVVVPGTGQADPKQLIEFCRSKLAHFKCPKKIVVVAELPVSATGKILRRVLREQLSTRE